MIAKKKYLKDFLKNGYCIIRPKSKRKLLTIRKKLNELIIKELLKKNRNLNINYLKKSNVIKNFHQYISPVDLNKFRMKIYANLNKLTWFNDYYYDIGKEFIDEICGNEIAMQRKVNLSIQLPQDDSSLLPIHSDVWSGCSPFEIVLWIPMLNVSKTSSMFVIPLKKSKEIYKKFSSFRSIQNLEKKIKDKIKYLKINFGEILIFSHQIIHGNHVNKESITRISFNCRFKSVFSPYDEKGLAETFYPINIKPASQLGMDYESPKI